MTTLLLIRHGIAEEYRPGHPDSERALTEEGWAKTRAAMRGLVARHLIPSRGISSPYRRAMETLTCLQEAAVAVSPNHAFPVGAWDGLTPDGDALEVDQWLRRLMTGASKDEIIAFTSHEPTLSNLIRHLTGEHLDVKKASCTVILWTGSGWSFKRHFKPAELRESAPS